MTISSSVLLITGCFLFPPAPVVYGVGIALYPPEGAAEYCFGVGIKATLGINPLFDDVFDQDDITASTQRYEMQSSGAQPYFAGMPLRVEVSCRDAAGAEVGRAAYDGKLMDPNQSAHFTLWNYEEKTIDPSRCVAPAAHSGVQMCGVGTNFRFD